jgi:hypothetical protein
MGLGIFAVANLRRKRAFGLLTSVVKPDAIAGGLLKYATASPLISLTRLQETSDHRFLVTLHPCAEPVFIETKGEEVHVSAKTSSIGAGYHAFLIDALRKLESDLGLAWNWDELDETGYARDKNFAKLQGAMRDMQRSIFQLVSERVGQNGGKSMRIAMSMDSGAEVSGHECATTMGPLSYDAVRGLAAGTNDKALDATLPWPEQGFGASMYKGLALSEMWNEMRWCRPLDEPEMQRVRRTLELCKMTGRLGGGGIPKEAIAALENITSGRMHNDFPEPQGLGYRRRAFTSRMPGANWRVEVPGSLRADLENDGTTNVWWNAVMAVRGSTMSGELDAKHAVTPETTPRMELRVEPNGDGEGWLLSATHEIYPTSRTAELCVVTVWHKDESLRPLAEKIAKSVKFNPPPQKQN